MEEKFRAFKDEEHSRGYDDRQRNIATNEQSLVKLLNEIGDQLTLNAKDSNNMNGTNGRVFTTNDLDNHRYRDAANNGTHLQTYRPPKTASDVKKRQMHVTNNSSRKSQQSQPLNRFRSQSVDYEALGCVFDIDLDLDIDDVENTNTNEYNYGPFSDDELDEDVIEFDANDDDQHLSIDSRNNYRNITQQSMQTETQTINTNAQQNAQNRHLMAFSLPIQVPEWRRSFSHFNYDDDDDDIKPVTCVKGENIAESIQQLAKSVWNDSDDVLRSARPSRYTDFGDLIKSRPTFQE